VERAITPLPEHPSVRELVRHALATSVDRLIRHDPGVRLGDDPEQVHQFRVAARTLRSNLKTFGPVLDREWARVLRGELGWLGTEAGRLRDLDVLEQRLRRHAEQLPAQDRPGVGTVLDRLAEQKAQARAATLAALRSHRYDCLVDALADAAASPRIVAADVAESPARRFVRRAARGQVRRLDRTVAAVSDPPADDELHRVRIQAKRTRYAIEAARPVIGRAGAEHAATLAHLQDVLGDFHDSVVAVQWLREAAAERPGCGVVAGQLIAAERAEQARLRATFAGAWRAADAQQLRFRR
jgi:CHAD domain-containing protein